MDLNSILTGLLLFIATGILGVLTRVISKRCKDHRTEHEQLKELIEKLNPLLEDHAKVHEKLNSNDEILKENAMIQTRETIVKLYYKGKKGKGLERYELEIVTDLYESYQNLDGNSYVSSLVKEIVSGTYRI